MRAFGGAIAAAQPTITPIPTPSATASSTEPTTTTEAPAERCGAVFHHSDRHPAVRSERRAQHCVVDVRISGPCHQKTGLGTKTTHQPPGCSNVISRRLGSSTGSLPRTRSRPASPNRSTTQYRAESPGNTTPTTRKSLSSRDPHRNRFPRAKRIIQVATC